MTQILVHKAQSDPATALRARLDAAPIEHTDAVLATYALLQELRDHGVLDLLRGLTATSGEIVAKVSEAANTPGSIVALRNIDPDILHGVANIVTKPAEPASHSGGFWKTVRRLGSKENRRAVGAAAYGLQVFGRVLITRQFREP